MYLEFFFKVIIPDFSLNRNFVLFDKFVCLTTHIGCILSLIRDKVENAAIIDLHEDISTLKLNLVKKDNITNSTISSIPARPIMYL